MNSEIEIKQVFRYENHEYDTLEEAQNAKNEKEVYREFIHILGIDQDTRFEDVWPELLDNREEAIGVLNRLVFNDDDEKSPNMMGIGLSEEERKQAQEKHDAIYAHYNKAINTDHKDAG